jgi:hypothetical protein
VSGVAAEEDETGALVIVVAAPMLVTSFFETFTLPHKRIILAQKRRIPCLNPGRQMMIWRSCAGVIIGIALLIAACTNTPTAASSTADQFIRAYFAEDDVAGAAKLASGTAKTSLDTALQRIEATGLKEPAKDKPRVKAALVEKKSVSTDAIEYVYRIDSEAPGIQPITAKLRVSKDGSTWSVSEFAQSP